MPLNIDWQQILLHLFNFVLLAGGLYFLLYKPVKKYMEWRKSQYDEREAETAKHESEVAQLRRKYEDMINDAEVEIQRMKEQASEELEAEKRQQLDEARAEARRIIGTAHKTAEIRTQKVLEDAHEEIRSLAVGMVEKLVLDNGSDALDRFLDEAERIPAKVSAEPVPAETSAKPVPPAVKKKGGQHG